ncbi:MAG: hypothetical protein H6807_01620 [Planctomycetes bacterium]|nr:hypothetical protein [Planctomycetota bacterium]
MSKSAIKLVIVFVAIGLGGLSALAQPAPEINSRQKNEVKKYLQRYAKARSDEEKEDAMIGLFRHGRGGLAFLESAPLKPDEQAAVEELKKVAPQRLGFDILKENKSVPLAPWSISYLKFGEICLVRKDDVFAGFVIEDSPEVATGKIKLTWWCQTGPAKKLDQAGGEKGELEIEGKKAEKPFKPNSGYDEYDFDFELGGTRHKLRFIGPAYFLFEPAPTWGFCFSGESKPGKLKNSDDSIVYVDARSDAVPRLTRQLQDYVYRIVPGAEPLNLSEAEKSQFAQYEAVQIFIRRQRRSSDLLVLIRFLEKNQIQFAEYHPDYIANFIREILPIDEDSLLISVGSAPSLEGNEYWEKGKWVRPKGKLIEKLRATFPEDY